MCHLCHGHFSDSEEDDATFERTQSLRDKLYARDVKFKDADADISFSGAAGEDIESILERFERVVSGSAPQKFYEVLLTRITNSTVKVQIVDVRFCKNSGTPE